MGADADPYAWHAAILAHGESREALAAHLRYMASEIERGGDGWRMGGGSGVLIVRQSSDSGGEEAGHARLYGVYPDGEGTSIDDVVALFSDEAHAREWAKRRSIDDSVLRTDVVLSAWNSSDPDPHAQ
jgi:hypothetical protein